MTRTLNSRISAGLRWWLAGMAVARACGALGATNAPVPDLFLTLSQDSGKQRIVRRTEFEAMKTGTNGAAPAFRAVLPTAWYRGLVPVYAVEFENRVELRRLPGRGQENFSEPLFLLLPNEDEAVEVLKISGRWEVKAARADKSPAQFAWEFAAEGGRIGGRFEQLTDFRFAYLNAGTFAKDRLEFTVEYIQDRYSVEGTWKEGRLAGSYRRLDGAEEGTWTAVRDAPEPPPLPANGIVPLHEWRRPSDNARHYGTGVEPPGPGWERTTRPLGRVWTAASLTILTNVTTVPSPRPAGRPVMTWVPHYAVARCRARLDESVGGTGPGNSLTYLGLQFWAPTAEGGLQRVGAPAETGDESIRALRDWGHAHGVRVLLCVYNGLKGWDWPLARAAFAGHAEAFESALISEVGRLGLDGVDLDLEGNGSFESDKAAYVAFTRRLAGRLHAEGRHLTADTFAYVWNAPNQAWWQELLPYVDALTTMGYDETGAKAPEWRAFAAQKAAAGAHTGKLMIGLLSDRAEWRGSSILEHLRWIGDDGMVGAAIWDAQFSADAWRGEQLWPLLRTIREGRAAIGAGPRE